MKKIILSFVLIFNLMSFKIFAENFSAQVLQVSGKAEVLNGTEWKVLSVGDTLQNGDTIQTGFKSSLVLKVKESTINVAALTRMTVEQLSGNSQKDDVRVFVKTGSVNSNVQKSPNKKLGFTVRTPVATASVRGTEFSVENTFNSVAVSTSRGSVAVSRGTNSVQVAQETDSSEGENSESEEGENFGGNSQDSSFENSPHGTVFVNQNQSAEISSSGNISSPSQSAASSARLEGATQSLSESESQQENRPSASSKSTKANLTVSVKIES